MPANFDTLENGLPTAAHKWEEQFFKKGQGHSIPSAEDLEKRIEQLRQAIIGVVGRNIDQERLPVKAWFREIAWRKKQLETRTILDGKEADDGDSEHSQ